MAAILPKQCVQSCSWKVVTAFFVFRSGHFPHCPEFLFRDVRDQEWQVLETAKVPPVTCRPNKYLPFSQAPSLACRFPLWASALLHAAVTSQTALDQQLFGCQIRHTLRKKDLPRQPPYRLYSSKSMPWSWILGEVVGLALSSERVQSPPAANAALVDWIGCTKELILQYTEAAKAVSVDWISFTSVKKSWTILQSPPCAGLPQAITLHLRG